MRLYRTTVYITAVNDPSYFRRYVREGRADNIEDFLKSLAEECPPGFELSTGPVSLK